MNDQNELIPLLPGEILRHERKKKALTLDEAAKQSKILPAVLAAIESGQTGEIPSVYLRGHIRHYAHFLGVDREQIDQYMEHVKGAEPVVQSVFEFKYKRRDADKWLKATSYIVASALVATLAWQFTHQAVRFSQSSPHLNASMASLELINSPEELPAGNDFSIPSAALQSPVSSNENQPSDLTVTVTQQLKIETSADTWLEILDATGQQLEMDLLRAGTSREYRGKAPFSVLVGRASAVELWFNGQLTDLTAHTRGNVARITLGGQLMTLSDQQAEGVKR
jgi:cytoskeleton protein RodZ